MSLCPACGEPLDDFSPCACALGFQRNPVLAERKAQKIHGGLGGMRAMVERKLRNRAAQSAAAAITVKGTRP